MAILLCDYYCICWVTENWLHPLIRHTRYLTRLEENVGALRTEIEDLNRVKQDLQRRVEAQERQLMTHLNQVKWWIQRADAIEGLVGILERNLTEKRRGLSGCYCSPSNYRLGKKVVEMRHQVALHNNKRTFDVAATTAALEAAGEIEDEQIEQNKSRILKIVEKRDIEINYLTNLGEAVRLLRTEMEELKCMKEDLERRVEEHEREGLVPFKQVKRWIERAEEIGQEAETLFAFQERRPLNVCCPISLLDYKLVKDVARMIHEVLEHKRQGNFNVVATKPAPPILEIDQEKIVGAEQTLNDIHSALSDNDEKIIGIYGMGGVGKTTMLKYINNFQRSQDFNSVIFVVVSKEPNVEKIQKEIGERLGLSWSEDEGQEMRARNLRTGLRTRKYLLLLDDLWEQLDLQAIGVPNPNNQIYSKIVFTTRSLKVCIRMRAHAHIKVDTLHEDHAWSLFKTHAGDVIDSPFIRPLAELVSQECGGLPVVLVTVARAMRGKEELQNEWEDTIRKLKNAPWELTGMKDSVFSVLKFSYDDLANEALKSCFLYCSLLPNDCHMEKEKLIEYWIAEGLIGGFDSVDEAYNSGYGLIRSLIDTCLLESNKNDEDYVKMHNVIWKMAIWIASESRNWIVGVSAGVEEAEKWKEAERISLMNDNEIDTLPQQPECPNLSTLMLRCSTVIPQRFFQDMPALRVLDLSRATIPALPSFVPHLVNLRVLVIHSAPELQLCYLGGLKHLQVLDLTDATATYLPDDLWGLTNLHRLRLKLNPSIELPEGIFKLTHLRRLNWEHRAFDKSRIWFSNRAGATICVTEPNFFRKFHGNSELSECFQRFHFCISPCADVEEYFQSKQFEYNRIYLKAKYYATFADYDRCLEINGCNNPLDSIVGVLDHVDFLSLREVVSVTELSELGVNHMKGLKECLIERCQKLESIVSVEGMTDEKIFESLHTIWISNLASLRFVIRGEVPHGSFACLKSIYLDCCPKLENIFPATVVLQKLESLEIKFCNKLEMIFAEKQKKLYRAKKIGPSEEKVEVKCEFPCLKYLILWELPELGSICRGILPRGLEKLKVKECPKLRTLPLGVHSSLEIRGEEKWWNNLYWLDEGIKSSDHFKKWDRF